MHRRSFVGGLAALAPMALMAQDETPEGESPADIMLDVFLDEIIPNVDMVGVVPYVDAALDANDVAELVNRTAGLSGISADEPWECVPRIRSATETQALALVDARRTDRDTSHPFYIYLEVDPASGLLVDFNMTPLIGT